MGEILKIFTSLGNLTEIPLAVCEIQGKVTYKDSLKVCPRCLYGKEFWFIQPLKTPIFDHSENTSFLKKQTYQGEQQGVNG